MPEFLRGAVEALEDAEALGFWPVLLRLALAGVLGTVVACFHAFSCRRRGVAADMSGTLIMLTMLISMVTMAIGNDLAKAFTLVGTLAIVRFRTNVRDIRDTVFVIFAVAVGLSMGANNPAVAVAGTLCIGVVSSIIAAKQGVAAVTRVTGRLTLRLSGAGPHDAVIDPVLRAHTSGSRIAEARIDKDGNARVAYEIDCAPSAGSALVASLDGIDVVQRAAVSFGADASGGFE